MREVAVLPVQLAFAVTINNGLIIVQAEDFKSRSEIPEGATYCFTAGTTIFPGVDKDTGKYLRYGRVKDGDVLYARELFDENGNRVKIRGLSGYEFLNQKPLIIYRETDIKIKPGMKFGAFVNQAKKVKREVNFGY